MKTAMEKFWFKTKEMKEGEEEEEEEMDRTSKIEKLKCSNCVHYILDCNYRKNHFYSFISLLMCSLKAYLSNKPKQW